MRRQRWISTIVVTAVLSGAWGVVPGSVAAAHSRCRSSVTITRHIGPRRCIPVPRRTTVYHHPYRRRFVRLGPPCGRRVVVYPPVTRHVVVHPAPTVTVSVPTIRVAPTTITLWITNSNGSKTSVQLTKEGYWYVGPRGEMYDRIPTNEQLRVVYGF